MSLFTLNSTSKKVPVFTAGKWGLVLLTLSLSACSSTSEQKQPYATNQLIDAQCQQNALAIENQARISNSSAQYLAAANTLSSCIDGLDFDKKSPEQKKLMQLYAVSTLNFIKGGDVAKAQKMIDDFQHKYPQQDLYFTDYTSFLDTTTALLSSESLTAMQLSTLNISRKLRDEIERKHYWLSH